MSVLELAKQALLQAKAINEAAQQNDWQKVEQCQKQYGNLINQIAIAEIPEPQSAEVRTILIECRTLSGEAEQMATDHKATLIKEKQTLSKANKMQKTLDSFK